MISAPKVVEDGLETPARAGDRSHWGWLAAGLLIGAGTTVLLLRADAVSVPTTTPTSTSIAGQTVVTLLGGIGDVVEGFPDGLVSTTRAEGRSLQLLIWPVAGEPYERAIPVGSATPPGPTSFDRSGTRLATILPLPDHEFGMLYAGVPEIASIVALDVTGFAWHDSQPHALAYTTFVDGELRLWVARDNLGVPELVTQAVGIDGHVAAWGDWGYAIQDDARHSIVLFTATGEIKDTHPGRVLDSYGTGWLAVEHDGVSLLSAGGGVRGLDREGLVGVFMAGAFSDNGESLALLTRERILVLSLDDDSELIESGGRAGVPEIAWSSDGRFVMYPGPRGIWVVEVDNGDVDQVLQTRTFTGLGALPLSSS
ncbi:MAG: hypothetical protein ACRDZM_03925 [Acidimicrobiia bacterium]